MEIENRLVNYKKRLDEIILEKKQQICTAPSGTLRIIRNKRTVQYYKILGGKAIYIQKHNHNLIRELAQKEYNKKILSRLENQSKYIKRALSQLKKNNLEVVYGKMDEKRRSLVIPDFWNKEEYGQKWMNIKYNKKTFSVGAPEFYTSFGLRVRSKSEILIAELLSKLKIPFRYEYPLEMKSGHIFHPDFYCLNVSTGQEIVWEHLGMMEDCEYAHVTINKINEYAKSGWNTGKNMILTMESNSNPLNLKVVEKIINDCLV